MKQPDVIKRKIVGEWLRKASADFELADRLLAELPDFCNAVVFSCQQAAEKYLKAFLAWHQVVFPKTHDLGQP